MGADPPETGDRARSGEIRGRLGGAGWIDHYAILFWAGCVVLFVPQINLVG